MPVNNFASKRKAGLLLCMRLLVSNVIYLLPAHRINIGGRAIFLVGGGGGGSSGETKIAEGIRDAKNCCFVLYIAFAGKSGGLQPPGSAAHDQVHNFSLRSSN